MISWYRAGPSRNGWREFYLAGYAGSGKSTITELNDAQLTLTQASLAQSQAVYNFVVAKSNLEKTLGYDFIDEKGDIDLENM